MTEDQLNLLIGYIQEKLQSLKLELQDCDTYWSDNRVDRILEDLTKTITGETT